MTTNTPARCLGVNEIMRKSVIGKFSQAINSNIQFPESSANIVGLTVASHIAALAFKTEYLNGAKSGIVMNAVVEQDSGQSKTRVMSQFGGYLESLANEENKRRAQERNKILELQAGKELTMHQQEQMEMLHSLNVFLDDSTVEAAQNEAFANNGYLSVRTTEMDFLNQCFGNSYSNSGKQGKKGLFLNGFDAGHFSVSRADKGRNNSGSVHVGVMCMPQEGAIKETLESSGNSGLAQRFNFWTEPSQEIDFIARNLGGNNPKELAAWKSEFDIRVQDIFDIYKTKPYSVDTLFSIKCSRYLAIAAGTWQNENRFKGDSAMASRASKSMDFVMRFAATLWLFDIEVPEGSNLLAELQACDFTIPDEYVDDAIELNDWITKGIVEALASNTVNNQDVVTEMFFKEIKGARGQFSKGQLNKLLKNRAPLKSNPDKAKEWLSVAYESLIADDLIKVLPSNKLMVG